MLESVWQAQSVAFDGTRLLVEEWYVFCVADLLLQQCNCIWILTHCRSVFVIFEILIRPLFILWLPFSIQFQIQYQIQYQIQFKSNIKSNTLANTLIRRFGFPNPSALDEGATGTECRGEEHDIVVVWSITSGKRQISMDTKEIHYSHNRAGDRKSVV